MDSVGLITVVVVGAFIFLRWRSNAFSSVRDIDADALHELRNKGELVIIDVRTPSEVDKGKIEGALNINWNSADFKEKVSSLDPSKTYVLYCRSGTRSSRAAQLMQKMGFKQVLNLKGGYNTYQSD